MAPPLTLVIDLSRPNSFSTAKNCAANASLTYSKDTQMKAIQKYYTDIHAFINLLAKQWNPQL